jgi:microcystin-dependent protein
MAELAQPFLGEVKIISWNFPPKGWAFCNGQLLQINQNQALFSILGTTYGGDGRTTFALPNLQGRSPIHRGNGFTLGEGSGETAHTLTVQELPGHTHALQGVPANGDTPIPTALANANNLYSSAAPNATLNPASIGNTGGSQAHENMSPHLVLNFVIALQGLFPSQN